MQVVVVGAGIAGLATALALERRTEAEILLLEQAPDLAPVGAGILLWPNALAVLDRLGIDDDAVEAAGMHAGLAGIRTPAGRWLRRVDAVGLERRVGRSAAFHRAELVELLRGRLRRTDVRLGCRVTSVEEGGRVTWSAPDGSSGAVDADVVAAADGIHSTTRGRLWDSDAPVDSGIVAARVVLDVPTGAGEEVWGRGAVAGHLPLRGGRTYVYAARRGTRDPSDLGWLLDWPDPFPRLAAAATADPGQVIVSGLSTLPPVRPWVRGRVALVGDAVHAMLPFLGQGACQGIEDADALAGAVAAGDLDRYEVSRRRRAEAVARASRSASLAAMADGPLAAVRDRVTTALPERLVIAQVRRYAAPRP